MKWVMFAGHPDKSDVILYTARVVRSLKQSRILLVDATKHQIYKNSVSSIDPESHIDEHDGMDVVTGVRNMEELNVVLTGSGETLDNYNYVFVDVDDYSVVKDFLAEKLVLVTSYSRPSAIENSKIMDVLKSHEAGVELLENMEVITLHVDSEIKQDFILDQLFGAAASTLKKVHTIYDDESRRAAQVANQFSSQVNIKLVPRLYKKTLVEFIGGLFGDPKEVKNVIKQVERGKI